MYVYTNINVCIQSYKYAYNCMYTQIVLLLKMYVYTNINDSEIN